MSLLISIRIEFYNKSIIECLCTLNTATLSTRAHMAPKSVQNTSNHVQRSFKVTHFEFTEKPTRNCVLLCNKVGFGVRIAKERSGTVFKNPNFTRRPCLGSPCEYSHKAANLILLETRIINLHFAWVYPHFYVQMGSAITIGTINRCNICFRSSNMNIELSSKNRTSTLLFCHFVEYNYRLVQQQSLLRILMQTLQS